MNIIMVVLIVATGTWSQYDPGVMEKVIRGHRPGGWASPVIDKDLSQYSVFVAVEKCSWVGRDVRVRAVKPDGTKTPWLNALVVDCSGDAKTTQWFHDHGIIGEVNHQFAVDMGKDGFGIQGELGILVYDSNHEFN